MNRWIISLIIIGLSGLSYGEIRTLTVSNTVELALQNNLQLQQAEKDMKIAEAQYNGSKSDFWMPGINLSGNYTYIDPNTVSNSVISLPVPLAVYVKPGVTVPYYISAQTVYGDNYSSSLSITKPLFAGFRLWNSMEMKRLNLEMTKAKYDDARKQVAAYITTSFYNLFLLKEKINLTADLNRNLKNRLDYTTDNFKAGAVSKFDMIRAEVAYKHYQPVLEKLTNVYIAAKMDFCNSIGQKDYENIEFIGSLMDSTNMLIDVTVDEAIPLTLSNDISMISLDFTIKTLKLAKDIASSAGYPVVSAFFNDKYAYGMENFIATNRSWFNSWTAGIQVSIPLDSLLPVSKAAYNADEAEQNIKKMELAKEQLSDGITLQVRNLFMTIDQAKNSIDSQYDTLNQSKLGLEIANNRYKEGTSSLLDVTDAEVSYAQSQVDYLQAIYDYFSSVIQLKRLTGK